MENDRATRCFKKLANGVLPRWSLTAYLVSKAGAAKLLDLAIAGLDGPLGTVVNRAALDGTLSAFAPRNSPVVSSRGTLELAMKRETADQFFQSNVLFTPTWVDPLDREDDGGGGDDDDDATKQIEGDDDADGRE